jgi:hypothetical protein
VKQSGEGRKATLGRGVSAQPVRKIMDRNGLTVATVGADNRIQWIDMPWVDVPPLSSGTIKTASGSTSNGATTAGNGNTSGGATADGSGTSSGAYLTFDENAPGGGVGSSIYNAVQTRKRVIDRALKDEKAMLEARKAQLLRWNSQDQTTFRAAFGTTDGSAHDLILRVINRELDLNRKYSSANFRNASDSDPKRFAYVDPKDSTKIYLDQRFWTAPPTGKDSRAGTLAHEMSHFNNVAGTNDAAYGVDRAANLARTSSSQALRNADNLEYYLEGAIKPQAPPSSTPLP